MAPFHAFYSRIWVIDHHYLHDAQKGQRVSVFTANTNDQATLAPTENNILSHLDQKTKKPYYHILIDL